MRKSGFLLKIRVPKTISIYDNMFGHPIFYQMAKNQVVYVAYHVSAWHDEKIDPSDHLLKIGNKKRVIIQ